MPAPTQFSSPSPPLQQLYLLYKSLKISPNQLKGLTQRDYHDKFNGAPVVLILCEIIRIYIIVSCCRYSAI